MNIIQTIRQELKEKSDEKTLKSSQNFSKEKIWVYGVKAPVVKTIGKRHFTGIKNKSKAEIFELCEELWKSGYLEEIGIACDWAYNIRKKYEPGDFKIFEKWTASYISNWAACDGLCTRNTGYLLELYPEHVPELKKWATSSNRWMRRAAAVSLVVPARHGKYLDMIFEIADILLMDKDDLVQKGYGWMLKVASQTHQKEVFDYVMKKKSTMPRTALRYAIEKMPFDLKSQALSK